MSDPRTAQKEAPIHESDGLNSAIEALLLSSDRPLASARIIEALSLDEQPGAPRVVREAVDRLNKSYETTGRSFRIEQVAGGYRAMLRSEHAPVLAALNRLQQSHTLSRAAVETMAIIAYKQPITRALLESIRGVGCGEVLRSLLDKRLIDITGRAEELGRPMLYGTTKRFLEVFGLASLKDLPNAADFAPPVSAAPALAASVEAKPVPGIEPAQDEAT